jgi:hypothetical protein
MQPGCTSAEAGVLSIALLWGKWVAATSGAVHVRRGLCATWPWQRQLGDMG